MRVTLLLLLVAGVGVRGCFACGIFGFLEEGLKIVNMVAGIAGEVDDLTGNSKHEELLHRFDALDTSIQELGRGVGTIITLLKDMESAAARERWSRKVERVESMLQDITSNYDRFVAYQKNPSAFEKATLLDFAQTAVSHDSFSLQSTLYKLRDVVLGVVLVVDHPDTANHLNTTAVHRRPKRQADGLGLFGDLRLMIEASRSIACGLDKSPQQVAYSLYDTLATVLAKDYAMTQFAYMLLRLLGKGSFKQESQDFTNSYGNLIKAMAVEASTAMRLLDPVYWRCDQPQHKRGTTYEEVTELLQGHIENEVDLSVTNTCTYTCDYYKEVQTDRCYDATGNPRSSSARLCERQRSCKGTLRHCRYVASSPTVCLARHGTHRRYNWLEYSKGQVMGQKHDPTLGSCDGVSSSSDWLRGFVWCSSCFCLCDDDTHSERYFSLLPATSDIAANKIVTGVRFVKIDGVFYIQVQQAVSDRLGRVNSSTIGWKPIERRINISRDVEGHDYVRLSYHNRSVLLQDLKASGEELVTGVSFNIFQGHLSLKIRVTAILETGVLLPTLSVWLSGNCSGSAPSPLKMASGPVPPTQSDAASWPDSRSYQTLKFVASSLNADAAQTTLPLLDIQPVAPQPAVWLAGVGLFHKGQPGGGGFLGLSVHMVDMTMDETRKKSLVQAARGGMRRWYLTA